MNARLPVLTTITAPVLLLAAVAMLTACGLSRGEIARKIAASPQIQDLRTKIWLRQDWENQAISENLIASVPPFQILDQKLASMVTGRTADVISWQLRQPIEEPQITITNVADDSSTFKEAYFDWRYSGIPSPLSHLAIRGGSGKAVLQHYDDGWEVQDITVSPDTQP